jgi:hypothetical protein
MAQTYVQFKDESMDKVVAIFPGTMEDNTQPLDAYPVQGMLEEDDPMVLAYLAPAEAVVITYPLEKLKAFLAENPDVAAILR